MIVNAILAKLFGTSHDREVKRLQPKVAEINLLSPTVEPLDDVSCTIPPTALRPSRRTGIT